MVRSNNMNRLAVGATTVLASMLSLAGIANGHVYNETMDPYNINKNQSQYGHSCACCQRLTGSCLQPLPRYWTILLIDPRRRTHIIPVQTTGE
jgi:hypothetical protein